MYLTAEDRQRLKEFDKDIEEVVRTNRQVNTAPWYVMADIKMKRTGMPSNGHCPACVFDLYKEFLYMINEYDKQV